MDFRFVICPLNCPFRCLLFSFLLSTKTKISGCSGWPCVFLFLIFWKGHFCVPQSRQIRRLDGDEHFLSGVNDSSAFSTIDRRLLTSPIRLMIFYNFFSPLEFDQTKSQCGRIKKKKKIHPPHIYTDKCIEISIHRRHGRYLNEFNTSSTSIRWFLPMATRNER